MKNVVVVIGLFFLLVACKEDKKQTPDLDTNPLEGTENPTPGPVTDKMDKPIKIVPIEHATAVVEWNNITIYIDPVGGAANFEDQKKPDLILITDVHGDHFSLETLESLDTEKVKIIAPRAVALMMPDTFTPQIDVLDNGSSKTRYGITVDAIPMYNLREEARQFHQKGRGNGYVLNLGNKRLYFSGDTEDIPEMRALENIDMAFICMNLPYTMTVGKAADAVLEFKPKQVYPYHYRGRPEVSDVAKFKELIEESGSGIEVVQLDWYPKDAY